MNNEQFREACEQIFIPKLAEFIHQQIFDLREALETLTDELQRATDRIDALAVDIHSHEDDEDCE